MLSDEADGGGASEMAASNSKHKDLQKELTVPASDTVVQTKRSGLT